MLYRSRNQVAIGSVVLLGMLALLQQWLTNRRPLAPDMRATQEFIVTSAADRGPGSLREAIFGADVAQERARIVLRVNRIVLRSPLPPLVNPLGVVIEAADREVEIDARSLRQGMVFDVDAPDSVISGLQISNAPEQAILARKDGLHILNTKIANCDEGLHAVEGINNLVVDRSSFDNNRIGVWLTGAGSGMILRNNRFHAHKDAAIWAVKGSQLATQQAKALEIRNNYFDGDRMSLVLGNTPAVIEENEFVKSGEAALFLMGEGLVVRGNRVRDSVGIGVVANTAQGAVIEANELDHNQALALLVRSSGNALVQKNRVYDNGYGIAFVLGDPRSPSVATENTLLGQHYDGIIVIGDSPIIKHNRALNSSLAGIRILDFIPRVGSRVLANPLLQDNTFDGNKLNTPMRGEYRVREHKGT